MREFLHHLFSQENKLYSLFLPHQSNNFRAQVLQPRFFAGYTLTFLATFIILAMLLILRPGILGVAVFFDPGQIIAKTNEVRVKNKTPELKSNPKLTAAAQKKAEDMVAKGYWAHFSPDGKTPWDFVREAGYEFLAAGENLARDFDSISPMVSAWLASPSHADNLLSSNFTEIGVGVAQGVISGKNTTVVVQIFGKPAFVPIAEAQPQGRTLTTVLEGQPLQAQQPEFGVLPQQQEIVDVEKLVGVKSFNLFAPVRVGSLALIGFVSILLFTDFTFVKFARIVSARGHPIFHLAILLLIFFAIWYSNSGLIL